MPEKLEAAELGEIKERPYTFFEQQIVRRIFHYYISEEIQDPRQYTDMIHRIQSASPDSIVYLHLNTPGGNLMTGIQLVNAMQTSEAHIICSIEGEVASLGTMIFLAADEFVVHDNGLMMFHNYSGGVFGKGHEQIAALAASTKWTEDIMTRLYIPFMTNDEVERIKKGEDMYIHSDEIRQRLVNMVKVLEKEKAAEAKAATTKTTKPRATKKKATPRRKAS